MTNCPAPSQFSSKPLRVVVIGGGPAGLMAAEVLASAGPAVSVCVYDAMPSVGRKFLLAGKGGLNLTHAEPSELFIQRYNERRTNIEPLLAKFGAPELRAWASALGVETFVGSTGRVFPSDMKAAPLLRAWLHRLRGAGVQFFMRHRWLGWTQDSGQADGALVFSTPAGRVHVHADAVVLALGGGSWARLGSDGAWTALLQARGVAVAALQPSNCGFDVAPTRLAAPMPKDLPKKLTTDVDPDTALPVQPFEAQQPLTERPQLAQPAQSGWTDHFSSRFAGQPFKSVGLCFTDSRGHRFERVGEFVATATGVEGSLIYAASSALRGEIAAKGSAVVMLDLLPHKPLASVLADVCHPRGSRSLSSHLKSRLGLDGIKAAILHELLAKQTLNEPVKLAHAIKALPLTLAAPRPIDEAISSAGGVAFEALSGHLQVLQPALRVRQPVFCAGEMLDWEAPTGGYLLTACFASGYAAGHGVVHHFGLPGK